MHVKLNLGKQDEEIIRRHFENPTLLPLLLSFRKQAKQNI